MECIELDNKIKITDVHDLDLAQTLDCGQSFRWKLQDDGSFHGVAYGKSVTVSLDKTDMYIKMQRLTISKTSGTATLTFRLITEKSVKKSAQYIPF